MYHNKQKKSQFECNRRIFAIDFWCDATIVSLCTNFHWWKWINQDVQSYCRIDCVGQQLFFKRPLFMKPIQVQSRHSVFGLHLGLFWYSGQKRNPFNPSPDWVSLLAARMAGWLWLVNFISCQIRVWFILDNNPIYIEFWTLIASVCQIQILAEPLPEPQQCCLWLPVTWYSNDFSDK